jgi:hypothetical protein
MHESSFKGSLSSTAIDHGDLDLVVAGAKNLEIATYGVVLSHSRG